MHTRQGVAVPAPSQDSARPFRIPASRFEAIDVINRLHGEALQITAAARIAGRFSPAQCARLRQINDENARAREVLNPPLPSIAPEPLLSAATGMYTSTAPPATPASARPRPAAATGAATAAAS